MKLGFTLMGFDMVADIDYRITHHSSRDCLTQYGWEPGDPLELEVDKIYISRDEGCGIDTPEHEATGGLFDAIYAKLEEKIFEVAYESEYDYDYYD